MTKIKLILKLIWYSLTVKEFGILSVVKPSDSKETLTNNTSLSGKIIRNGVNYERRR